MATFQQVVDGSRGEVIVERVSAAATRPLRLEVLRPGQPPEEAVYPGDDAPGSLHLAARRDGAVVGIASLYQESRADGPEPGWRLRGMATAPGTRGQGVGRALLAGVLEHVAAQGGGELWCNARVPARGFYDRNGFETVSAQFDIAGIGPHVVMRRLVPPA